MVVLVVILMMMMMMVVVLVVVDLVLDLFWAAGVRAQGDSDDGPKVTI